MAHQFDRFEAIRANQAAWAKLRIPEWTKQLEHTHVTLAEALRDAGYKTAHVGKWHLATEPQGYDYSEILIGQGPYYNPPMIRNGERVSHEGYTTNIITDLTLDWLKNQRDSNRMPFCLLGGLATFRPAG